MTALEILTLARAYAEHERMSLSTVGVLAVRNNQVFRRLAEGGGADIRTVERAAAWFVQNWPMGLAWPETVRRPPKAAKSSPTSG